MIKTDDFELKVYYVFDEQTNAKSVLFKNKKGDIVHTVKYRTRKIKQPNEEH